LVLGWSSSRTDVCVFNACCSCRSTYCNSLRVATKDGQEDQGLAGTGRGAEN
jgi:hypothetical protein